MARFVMAGGGTGGHVIPLLAVAKELVKRGHEVMFAGTRHGIESRLVPAAGYPIEWIEIGGLKRVGFAKTMRAVWRLPLSVWQMLGLFRRFRPAAVFSLGGYVAGPAVLAAILRRVPVVAMEPNAIPGLTARWTARWTDRALLAFEEAQRYFPHSEVSGLPVRDEFFRLQRKPGPFTVLITGGSQGSRTLNRAFRESLPRFREAGLEVQFVHQSGEKEREVCEKALRENGVKGEVHAFLSDMPAAFAGADVVVCRSGAGTVAELAAAGKAALLVPFPFAADDHQTRNAETLARAGAARIVEDAHLTGERLFREIANLAAHPEVIERIGRQARGFAKPGAAGRAADVLEEAAGFRHKSS